MFHRFTSQPKVMCKGMSPWSNRVIIVTTTKIMVRCSGKIYAHINTESFPCSSSSTRNSLVVRHTRICGQPFVLAGASRWYFQRTVPPVLPSRTRSICSEQRPSSLLLGTALVLYCSVEEAARASARALERLESSKPNKGGTQPSIWKVDNERGR